MEHKEILTREHIKEDLKDFPKWRYVIEFALAVIILGVFIYLYYHMRFFCILYCVLEVIAIAGLVRESVITIRYLYAYKSERFVVAKDVLRGIGTSRGHFFFLNFTLYKRLCMPTRKRFYKWSNMYCLDEDGIRVYSSSGDTFYIVTVDGKHPLVVYNTKLFEYKE